MWVFIVFKGLKLFKVTEVCKIFKCIFIYWGTSM
jgi:hypothetical protein